MAQSSWKLQSEVAGLKKTMEESEKLHQEQIKATEAKLVQMERRLKEQQQQQAGGAGTAAPIGGGGGNVEKSMEAWRWNTQFQALVRQVQQLEKDVGSSSSSASNNSSSSTTATGSPRSVSTKHQQTNTTPAKAEFFRGAAEKKFNNNGDITTTATNNNTASKHQFEQLSKQLQQQSKELRDVKEELRTAVMKQNAQQTQFKQLPSREGVPAAVNSGRSSYSSNKEELRTVTQKVFYGKINNNNGRTAAPVAAGITEQELKTLKEEMRTLREEAQLAKEVSEQLVTTRNEFRSFRKESNDAFKAVKEELAAVKGVLSANQDDLRATKEQLESNKKENALENESLLSKIALENKQEESNMEAFRIELDEVIKKFWADSEKLEQHLSNQFKEQEKQLLSIKDERINEQDLREMMDEWDKQFEELVQFVQEHRDEEKALGTDLQESVQSIKEQNGALQLKLEAVSTTWESKLEQFKRWVQKPVADERIAHRELRDSVRADIDQELKIWNEQVAQIATFIQQQLAKLKAVQRDTDEGKLKMDQKAEQFKTEFEQLLERARHNNDIAKSINDKLRKEWEELQNEELERRQKLDAEWKRELEDKVQITSKALKATKESLKMAVCDRDDARKEAEAAKDMYQQTKAELDDVNALLSDKDGLTAIKEKRQQIKANLNKRKDLLRELLSEEGHTTNLVGIEVEARDAD